MRLSSSLRRCIFVFALSLSLLGCASTSTRTDPSFLTQSWVKETLDYRAELPRDHPHLLENLTQIPTHVSDEVWDRFGHLPRNRAIDKMARWLIDEDGHALRYDLSADLAPADVYEDRLGNCLSFTILLVNLAKELGILVEYNEVDMPATWGSIGSVESVLFEHVNAIQVLSLRKRVFDLAIGDYRHGYPQKTISESSAIAKLLSNRSVNALSRGELNKALHFSKLAVSYDSQSSTIWSNYAVSLNRNGLAKQAESAFLYSLDLDPFNTVSASNLERFYNTRGDRRRASQYKKMAWRARKNNPYYHFQVAKDLLEENRLKRARQAINMAINLHGSDPKFYELASTIDLQAENYLGALHALGKAYKLSKLQQEKQRYAAKFLKLEQKGQHQTGPSNQSLQPRRG